MFGESGEPKELAEKYGLLGPSIASAAKKVLFRKLGKDKMNLTGKVAFVTGGSRGIGRAISKKLAYLGANVFTFNERQMEAEKVVREIKDLNGNAIFAKMNVRKRLEVSVAMEMCKDSFDGIDILVNNVGINMPTDFDKILDNDWDEIMATNLKGPFICSQLAIKFMKERGGGSIINIGSVSGTVQKVAPERHTMQRVKLV